MVTVGTTCAATFGDGRRRLASVDLENDAHLLGCYLGLGRVPLPRAILAQGHIVVGELLAQRVVWEAVAGAEEDVQEAKEET